MFSGYQVHLSYSDVVFFGESLPPRFMEHFFDIAEADLVIIMGTSLKVYPFTSLLSAMPACRHTSGIDQLDSIKLSRRYISYLDSIKQS